MGTRGLVVVCYKGRYYIVWVNSDAYPTGMRWVVREIPMGDRVQYEQWLAKHRMLYQELQDSIDQTLNLNEAAESIGPGLNILSLHSQLEKVPFYTRCQTLYPLFCLPSARLPLTDLWVEYVYIIDLDQEIFSINNHYHFPLSQITPNWDVAIEAIPSDGFRYPVTANIREFLAGSSVQGLGFVHKSVAPNNPHLWPGPAPRVSYWTFVKPKPLDSLRPGKRSVVRFASRIFNAITGMNSEINLIRWNHLSLLDSSSLMVRETIFAVLCLASADPNYLQFTELNETYRGRWDDRFDAAKLNMEDCEGSDSETLSRLGSSSRHGEKEAHIAPESRTYWFKGALICLWDCLEDEAQVQASRRHVVEYAISEGVESFYAIIISITHVVLLQMLPGRCIRTTGCLKLANLDRPRPTSQRELYFHTPLEKLPVCSEHSAFAAIAQLLEAAQCQKLAVRSSPRRLPLELEMKILEYSDLRTRAKVATLCTTWRGEFQKRGWFTESWNLYDTEDSCYIRPHDDMAHLHSLEGPAHLEYLLDSVRMKTIAPKTRKWVPVVGCPLRTRSFLVEGTVQFSENLCYETPCLELIAR